MSLDWAGVTPSPHGPQPWLVRSDVDGFFGLAIDNLVQFLLILALCQGVLGFPADLVLTRVLPGAALSILLGNLFYAWQAQRLSARTGRRDVTALPYGINTVSLFAYVFLVMLPVRLEALEQGMGGDAAARVAWQVGLGACLVSALIEMAGAAVAERVRRATPRAALLSTLAGIAISFIAIDFAVRTFASPLVALLPLGVILATYFGRVPMPLRLPGGLWAVSLGTGAAWLLAWGGWPDTPVEPARVAPALGSVGLHPPIPVLGDLVAGLTHPLFFQFLVPVMLPMGLFNVLGSLQNIESAEAAGDPYPTLPSLTANGLGSVAASLFGSCFPTTIYIGHPGWKALGARTGYSVLNGAFFAALAVLGVTALVDAVVPMEAGMAIVLWIGIVITAQAFQATPREHAPAVALGLFPSIAGWGVVVVTQTLGAAGNALGEPTLARRVLDDPGAFAAAGLQLPGMIALAQGFMLTCVVWAAASAHLIDRRLARAAVWMGVGALLSFFGFIHAGRLGPSGGEFTIGWAVGWTWAVGYALCGAFFLLTGRIRRNDPATAESAEPPR